MVALWQTGLEAKKIQSIVSFYHYLHFFFYINVATKSSDMEVLYKPSLFKKLGANF